MIGRLAVGALGERDSDGRETSVALRIVSRRGAAVDSSHPSRSPNAHVLITLVCLASLAGGSWGTWPA